MQLHQLLQQRRDVLGALLIRTQAARGEFAQLARLPKSEKPVRYQVRTVGPKAYHIIDLITGKTRGFRFQYASAIDFAIQLEVKTNRLSGDTQ